jgi:hypothetical protein
MVEKTKEIVHLKVTLKRSTKGYDMNDELALWSIGLSMVLNGKRVSEGWIGVTINILGIVEQVI